MQDQYRKGLVLGLTMAEVMILLLFGLMLALVNASYESDDFQEIREFIEKNGYGPSDVKERLTQNREFREVLERKGLEWSDAKEFLEQMPDVGESSEEDGYSPSDAKEHLAQIQELQRVIGDKGLELSDAKEFLQQLPDPKASSGDNEYGLSDAKEHLVQHQELQDVLDKKGIDLSDAKEFLEQMPDADENEAELSDAKERLAQLQELNEILEDTGLDPREARDILEQHQEPETEETPEQEVQDPQQKIADLKKENDELQQEIEDIREEYAERTGRGGIDLPPCWPIGLTSAHPSFEVDITSWGYEFRRLETPKRVPTDSVALHDGITTDRLNGLRLSPAEMLGRTAELFRWSREQQCVFFARSLDCTGPQDKQLYKERRRVLESVFYPYAPGDCRSN